MIRAFYALKTIRIDLDDKSCGYLNRKGRFCGECKDNFSVPADLDDKSCGYLNRKGRFCGECKDNFSVPACYVG